MAEKHKYRHMHSIELQDFSPQARHVHNQRPTTAPPGSAPEKPAMAASFLGGISFFMSLWSKPKEEAEKHLGHEFEVSSNPTWCDLCGDVVVYPRCGRKEPTRMVESTMAEKLFQSPNLLTLLSDLDHKEECTTREDLSSYLCELYDLDTLVEGRGLQRHKKKSLAEEIVLLSTFLDGNAQQQEQVREDKLGYYDSDLESLSECDVNLHLQYPNVSSLKCQISMILHKVMVIEDRLRRLTGSKMDLLNVEDQGNLTDFDETLDDVATESDPGTGDSGYSGSGLKTKPTEPIFSPCRGPPIRYTKLYYGSDRPLALAIDQHGLQLCGDNVAK
ncbi:Ras association [Branchiostoma belcheri]|nr:Ras association [Branchiostoma belcheri]